MNAAAKMYRTQHAHVAMDKILIRPPTPDHGSTAYLFSQGPELTIVLWGFGLFCRRSDAEPAGLFLKRYEFTPRMTP